MMKQLMAMTLAFSMTGAIAQDKPKKEKKPAAPAEQVYKVDTGATKVEWVGKKVTGEHRGLVKVKEGSSITLKGEEITSGNIIVDMNSMTVTDLTDQETAAKFLGHMKSADFFNVEKYPEATLVITKSKKSKDGLEVEGNLTVLDKSNPVKFTATEPKLTGDTYTSKAMVTVDRTKHGLKYGSGAFFKGLGDKMIYDDFTLNIELSAKKQ